MKITKDDLALILSKNSKDNIGKVDLKIAITEMFDSISNSLIQGNRVELRGFGSFALRKRQVPADPRNNNTANLERVACNSVHYKMSKNLSDRLNK